MQKPLSVQNRNLPIIIATMFRLFFSAATTAQYTKIYIVAPDLVAFYDGLETLSDDPLKDALNDLTRVPYSNFKTKSSKIFVGFIFNNCNRRAFLFIDYKFKYIWA